MIKLLKILISLLIAISFTYTYFENKLDAPQFITNTMNGFTLETNSIPTFQEDTLLTIKVLITGPNDSTLNFQFRNSKGLQSENTLLRLYARTPLTKTDSSRQAFSTSLRSPQKGAAVYYYFEILDPIGRRLAELKMPDDKPFKTIGIGNVPEWINYFQLSLLFMALFSIAYARILAFDRKNNYALTSASIKWFMVSWVCLVPGVYLFETLSRMHQIGEDWQGVPFGTNPSDNLLQIVIVFIFLLVLSSKHLMDRSGQNKSVISKALYRQGANVALVLILAAIAFADNINFDPSIIEGLSYSILSLFVLSYAVILYRAKNG